MGPFCKMGSLFLENGFTFFAKNGFNFNEWVHFYNLQTIKTAKLQASMLNNVVFY